MWVPGVVDPVAAGDKGPKDTNKWTRVFTRDLGKNLQPGIYQIGPDLIYDRSIRNSMSELAEVTGEVVFSPMVFKKTDVSGDLDSHRISSEQLLGLGQVSTSAKARF